MGRGVTVTRKDRIREFLEDELKLTLPTFPIPVEQGVPVSGKVYGFEELVLGMEAVLDGWWTSGKYSTLFSRQLARFVGSRHAILTNSGSSANLLSLSALTSRQLEDKRLKPGDEVIVPATSFPTTVNPIIQNQLVPVMVDIELGDYNLAVGALEEAVSPRTRAIIAAHTLGNPFDIDRVMAVAQKHNLWVIEDSCDALGARWRGKMVGSFGDMSTGSFYPAHHLTTGEGGVVYTNHPRLKTIVESFRDWGRDCWCDTGCDDTCGRRFTRRQGELPYGYDHKYTYSHIGYNLKMTDIQAAIGLAQIGRLPGFIDRRQRNFAVLHERLAGLSDQLILPRHHPDAEPSWFGYPITLRSGRTLERQYVITRFQKAGIHTRLLFAGNVLRQPAYRDSVVRVVGTLEHADYVMHNTFWVGVYPGLDQDSMHFIADTLENILTERMNTL